MSKILFILPVLLLAACNTVEGVGEDIQAGGRGIERGAEATSRSMSNDGR